MKAGKAKMEAAAVADRNDPLARRCAMVWSHPMNGRPPLTKEYVTADLRQPIEPKHQRSAAVYKESVTADLR
jgi:hypothetical protein